MDERFELGRAISILEACSDDEKDRQHDDREAGTLAMKQRILVMNGQRIVQSEFDSQWVTTKVGKAGQLQPGIYNLSAAVPASKDKTYDGVVLHSDQEHIYQQVGKTCVRHSAHDFLKVPAIGTHAAIRYDANQATAGHEGVIRGRGARR